MRNRIEEYRKPLGLSQHRLGEKIGISRIRKNKIESRKTIPNLKTANDIANILGFGCIRFSICTEKKHKCHSCNCW
ncbi:helix-turn-helix transcriptional regulator [uncultured Catenibacterium sp.]|uniref:helix-turn-helix transcriptional regulator n=1 Tax=uncultured Catenibacterium sp. TaxID=286142 RepID=UPI00338D64EA